jgi:hypothetical protein
MSSQENKTSPESLLAEAQAQISQLLNLGVTSHDDSADDEEETITTTSKASANTADDEDSDTEEEHIAEEDTELEEDKDSEGELTKHEQQEIERARKAGWRPKEEYNGNPADWKDYNEFNAVGDRIVSNLHNRIDTLTQQNDKQREAINKLIRSQGAVAKQAYEKALEELKAQRKEAIQFGDVEIVDELDEKIGVTKQQLEDIDIDEDEAEKQPEIDDAVKQFMEEEKNWFNQNNPDMVEFAINIESVERKLAPKDSSEAIMRRVKEAVVGRFKERAGEVQKPTKQRKQAKQTVLPPGEALNKDEIKLSDMPKEVQQMADFFERECGISKKEYLKQVREGMNR